MDTDTEYASFLVRMWREPALKGRSPDAPWKGELEHIQSGRHWAFDGLEELFTALRQEACTPGERTILRRPPAGREEDDWAK